MSHEERATELLQLPSDSHGSTDEIKRRGPSLVSDQSEPLLQSEPAHSLGLGDTEEPEGAEKEPKKQICDERRVPILRRFCFFHLPAISATLVLMSLYIAQVQWADGYPTSEQLSALQFAAKAHESLIIMSLTDILLHRISYGLLRGEIGRVSFGFLSSPFHITSPVPYLFSWEFWGAVSNPPENCRFHGTTTSLIVLLLLIGVAAGPFSVILMIPRLAWWLIGGHSTFQVLVDIQSGDAYPLELESQTLLLEVDSVKWCDQGNISAVIEGLEHHDERGLPTFLPNYQNVSALLFGSAFSQTRPITYALYQSYTFSDTQDYYSSVWSIATAPMMFVVSLLMGDFLFDEVYTSSSNWLVRSRPDRSTGLKTWKQPLVAVTCYAPSWGSSHHDELIKFKIASPKEDFMAAVDLNLTVELAPTNDRQMKYRPEPIFLDPQNQVPAQLTATILLMNNVTTSKRKVESYERGAKLCAVQARWVDSDTWFEGWGVKHVTTDIGMSLEAIPSLLYQTSDSGNVIKMHKEWLARIGTRTSVFTNAFNTCPESTRFESGAECLSTFLSLYLTNALSAVNFTSYDYDIDGPKSKTTLTSRVEGYTHLYAYNFQDRASVQLAMFVLLLHVIIALSHFGVILFSRKPWTSSGWGSFGQMLALAAQSRAPRELRNVGAGVESSHTWRKVVSVREVVDEQRLEMVFGAPGDGMEERNGEGRKFMQSVMSEIKYR